MVSRGWGGVGVDCNDVRGHCRGWNCRNPHINSACIMVFACQHSCNWWCGWLVPYAWSSNRNLKIDCLKKHTPSVASLVRGDSPCTHEKDQGTAYYNMNEEVMSEDRAQWRKQAVLSCVCAHACVWDELYTWIFPVTVSLPSVFSGCFAVLLSFTLCDFVWF